MSESKDIRIISLYSGSKGNSTYCSIGGREFLIDAGGSYKALCTALLGIGSSIERISDIFITHEHVDHISALRVMLKKVRPRVHMCEISAREAYRKTPELYGKIIEHSPLYEVSFGEFSVRSFVLSHDSAGCVGYIVEKDGEKIFGSATDTGFISEEAMRNLSGCKYAQCEANHDVDMLLYGPYPPFLKERILSDTGHLSNYVCAGLVKKLFEKGSERIMLAHLSEENNTPEKAYADIICTCTPEEREKIRIASQRHSEVLV